MFFKTVKSVVFLLVTAICFVIFVMECIAVTTSWHITELSSCKQTQERVTVNGTTSWQPLGANATAQADKIYYLQPRKGMCWVSNAITVKDDDCHLWTDTAFWESWSKTVNAGDTALYDTANLMPNVYDILVASTVLSMFTWQACAAHISKPEQLSRWMVQFFIAVIAFVSVICFLYATIGATASVLVSPEKWNQYRFDTEGITCSILAEEPYYGVEFTAVALALNVIVFFIAAFPSCFGTCMYCVDVDGDVDTGESPSMTSSIMADKGKESQSDYVPPAI